MNCTICHKPFLEGKVINDEPYCPKCVLSEAVQKLVKKFSVKDHDIILALKQCGLRGNIAKGYYKNPEYSLESLIRYVWLFRYYKSINYTKNYRGLIYDLLKRKYLEPEAFWAWYKNQMANPWEDDFAVLYRSI